MLIRMEHEDSTLVKNTQNYGLLSPPYFTYGKSIEETN